MPPPRGTPAGDDMHRQRPSANAALAPQVLFEDDEARKAILDLRTKLQANEDAAKQRNDQLAAQLQ